MADDFGNGASKELEEFDRASSNLAHPAKEKIQMQQIKLETNESASANNAKNTPKISRQIPNQSLLI